MSFPKVYFDESGNSGENLLDADQPIYCIASLNMPDENVDLLLSRIESKGTELHFKNLKKSNKYQKQILEILNHDSIQTANIKYYTVNKEFAVVGHIVDRLIEPVVYDTGEDLYRNKVNLQLTNLIYHFGNYVWNQHLYKILLLSFQEMARKQTEDSIKNFYTLTTELKEQTNKESVIIDLILASRAQIDTILKGLHKYAIDLSLPLFIEICDNWGRQFNQAFDIIHDDSKQISFWSKAIEFYSNTNYMIPQEVGFNDRKIKFPLNINSLSFMKSENSRHIQLADIITSSVTYAVKVIYTQRNPKDEFANNIYKSRLMNIESNLMWPSLDHKPTVTPDDEINILDYLVQAAEKNIDVYKDIIEKTKRK
ncbi:MAG: DUF3800 domain-containing protein [Cyclobacteriaceae bacterium]|nr:DUF3800 domain-containing protein [Cyclobacteriaceae bacterium]